MPPQFIRNPFVWLYRFRHRRGYGIHSPWAYSFVRDVILERTPYYDFEKLAALHPWYVRWLFRYRIECLQLLFRLANYADGRHFNVYSTEEEEEEMELIYIGRAKESMDIPLWHEHYVTDFLLVKSGYLPQYELQPCKMLVLEGIHHNKVNRQCWEAIKADPRTGCTFDLYTYGIVFFDLSRHKQHYIVNF